MGWKDALQSVRAGPAGLYPGAHARQEESPPEGGDPPSRDQKEKACGRVAACQSVRSEVSSVQRHQQHQEQHPPQPQS